MGKGGRLRCKNSCAVERQLDELAPYSKERRSFLCSVATAGAGLPGSAILSLSAEAQRKEASPKAFAASGCGNSRVIASDKTVAETTAGKIRGFRRNGVYIFKGVPYGASTAGPRRFMPTASPEPWSGIRNALQYGRVCPNQDCAHLNTDGKNLASTDEDAFVLHRGASATIPGEDCLRLNLWSSEINGSHKRPVMVYMHGGGFSNGSGHDLQAIRKAAFRRAPGYPYIYAWRAPVLDRRPGPFHAAELAFTLDNAELCDHYSGGSIGAIVISKQISTAWVSFARTGNPNHNDLPYWPKYTSERRATMQFDSTCAVSNDPEGQGLRLIAAA